MFSVENFTDKSYIQWIIHYKLINELIHSSWIFDQKITHFYKIQHNIEDYARGISTNVSSYQSD